MYSLKTIKLLCKEQLENKLTMETHVARNDSHKCKRNKIV